MLSEPCAFALLDLLCFCTSRFVSLSISFLLYCVVEIKCYELQTYFSRLENMKVLMRQKFLLKLKIPSKFDCAESSFKSAIFGELGLVLAHFCCFKFFFFGFSLFAALVASAGMRAKEIVLLCSLSIITIINIIIAFLLCI